MNGKKEKEETSTSDTNRHKSVPLFSSLANVPAVLWTYKHSPIDLKCISWRYAQMHLFIQVSAKKTFSSGPLPDILI